MGKENEFVQLIYPNDNRVPEAVCRLRSNIGGYVSWLLENVFRVKQEDIRRISVIGASEGVRSACISVHFNDGNQNIVKMAPTDFDLDAEALGAWDQVGVSTPKVIGAGEFPREVGPVGVDAQYLIMSCLQQVDGTPAVDGYPFLDGHYSEHIVGEFGSVAGGLLAQAHTAVAIDRQFGGQDIRSADTYEQMLRELISTRATQLNLGEIDVNALLSILPVNRNYQGVWVHNDFGPHNLLVIGENPIRLALIDPFPIVAHPYWDLATAANRLDWLRLQFAGDPGNQTYGYKLNRDEWYYAGLICGYQKFTGREINESLFLISRIGQLMWKICHTEKDGFYLNSEDLVRIHNLRKQLLLSLISENNC